MAHLKSVIFPKIYLMSVCCLKIITYLQYRNFENWPSLHIYMKNYIYLLWIALGVFRKNESCFLNKCSGNVRNLDVLCGWSDALINIFLIKLIRKMIEKWLFHIYFIVLARVFFFKKKWWVYIPKYPGKVIKYSWKCHLLKLKFD